MGEDNAGVALINLGVEISLVGVDMASMILGEPSLFTVYSMTFLAGVENASMVGDSYLFPVSSNVFLVGVERAPMLVKAPSSFSVYSMDLIGVARGALDDSREAQLVGEFTELAASDAKSDGEGCNESNAEFCCISSAPSSLHFKENRAL